MKTMAEGTLTEGLDETSAEETPSETTGQNYLDTLVGGGKKYLNTEDLAKAYSHADRHIVNLEDKLDETQDTNKILNEVLSELRKTEPTTEEEVPGTLPATPRETVRDEGVDEKIAKAMERQELVKKAHVNSAATMQLLVSHYGNKGDTIEAIKKLVGDDNGLRETVDHLGNTNPQMAFRAITGQDVPKPVTGPNTPGMGKEPSETVTVKPAGIKTNLTWKGAMKLRKENPRKYRSPAFQKELVDASTEYQNVGLDFHVT
jgi:hypothetical protein